MHIEVEKEELLKYLGYVARIATKHQTLPVLSCVLLDATTEKGLVLRATNLELGVEAAVPAKVVAPGVCAVPVALLEQTVALRYERSVALQVEGDLLSVRSGKARAEIKTLPHDEFPTLPRITKGTQSFESSLFALGVKTAAIAAAQSSIKPELGSILIHQKQERTLTFVATDAFRLVEKTLPERSVRLDAPLLVPQKNALELARIAELAGGAPMLAHTENQLALEFENGVYATSRLTEASFPDYQQIIPKEFSTTVTLLRGDLAHALKQTNLFTNTYLQVRVTLDPEKNAVTFAADNGERGSVEETIAAEITGEALSMSFNQRYLADPLPLFVDDSIVLRFAGIGRPLVVEGMHEKSLRYLVMPMNR